MSSDPVAVKLFVVTDWDAGFQLSSHPPLPDVGPGETYVTECKPQYPILIHEVFVDGFALVQISVGDTTPKVTIDQTAKGRSYRLEPALAATPEDWIRVHLCNDTDVPRKQKLTALVKAP